MNEFCRWHRRPMPCKTCTRIEGDIRAQEMRGVESRIRKRVQHRLIQDAVLGPRHELEQQLLYGDPNRRLWEFLTPRPRADRRRAEWKVDFPVPSLVRMYRHYLRRLRCMPRKGRIEHRGERYWLSETPHENALTLTARRCGIPLEALRKHLRGNLR